MGIPGLTSFLHENFLDKILEDIKLSRTLIVIDACSFLHKIHSIKNLTCAYSGNYDDLSLKLHQIFDLFKKCQIEPIFLIDGARDISGRKFETNLKRARKRIKDTSQLNVSCSIDYECLADSGNYRIANNLLPILARQVFIEVLAEYNFIYFQCFFEADYQLACLANRLKCPVVSCDSDFYIFDLDYGYICIEDIDFNVYSFENQSDQFYLPAKIYKIDQFLTHLNRSHQLNLRKNLLPVFAVMCGNDYIERSTFNSLLKTFDSTNNNLRRFSSKKQKSKQKSASYVKQKNSFYFKLFKWLNQFENLNECLTSLLKFVKNDNKNIEHLIDDTINEYCLFSQSMASVYCEKIKLRLNLDNKQNCEWFQHLYTIKDNVVVDVVDKQTMVFIIKLVFVVFLILISSFNKKKGRIKDIFWTSN
jgi:hypothetical protein